VKCYELKSEEELAAIFKRQEHERLDLGNTVEKLLEFFASGDQSKAAAWVRGGQKGTGVREGAGCQGEGNGPTVERGEHGNLDLPNR
jgi:hypothetical protein